MEPDEHADVHDGEDDRGVEHASVPVGPGLEITPPLPPHEEEEERDREEERDLEKAADRREHGLERERDHDDRRNRDEGEPAHERRNAVPEPSHVPVMNARTASAPARNVVPANQSRRFGPTDGA